MQENCVRLGSMGKNETWHCDHCNRDIPGSEVILDIEADAYACPHCLCWDSCWNTTCKPLSDGLPAQQES